MFCSIVADIESSPFLIRIHDAYPKHDSSSTETKILFDKLRFLATNIETNESIVNMYNPIPRVILPNWNLPIFWGASADYWVGALPT